MMRPPPAPPKVFDLNGPRAMLLALFEKELALSASFPDPVKARAVILVAAALRGKDDHALGAAVFRRVVVGVRLDFLQRVLIGQHGGLVPGRALNADAVEHDV